MSHGTQPDSALRRWSSTVPALLLLTWALVNWTANALSGKMIQLGEAVWPGYAIELRVDRAPPSPPAPPTPAAPPAGGADDALIGDLLADEPAAATTDPTGADDALIGDLLEGEGAPSRPGPAAEALPSQQELHAQEVSRYDAAQARLSPVVRVFRWVDTTLGALSLWGSTRTAHLLVLLLLVAGATATATRAHISLRPVRTRLDDRVSQSVQLVANVAVVASMVRIWQLNATSGTEIHNAELPLLWAAAFGLMALLNIFLLARPGDRLAPGGRLTEAGLTVPLYAGMALLSSLYFVAAEDYVAGLAVYLQKLTEHGELYIYVGLYVWAGMLLKRTRVAQLAFEVLRPWRLPPELLAIVVVLGAAVPTAYSGASGIFVIAVGALIYQELRSAGARPQLALAATALSGSLGVVLRPCLLVVIVAYLNPPTTDVLYGWGRWVFLLTSGLFAIAVLVTRQGRLTVASPGTALPESIGRLKALLPYALLAGALLAAYAFGLDAPLDEHTAPVILPVVLLAVMGLERRRSRGGVDQTGEDHRPSPLEATSETTTHMGALILLMSLSIALGGVFERSEIMDLVPQDLGSTWGTMGLLVGLLVVIGMTMDPYGAVILVSATLAELAYSAGIDPAHFWMVVLVAFELGYLTPPVALNHLLTRQVVGADAVDEAIARTEGSFWFRHERVLLPITVMGTALILVAFVPLLFSGG